MRPHPRRTVTNPRNPRAWGTCDRSGFITNHEKLCWQFDWRGTHIENLHILVCADMLDEPQRQLGVLILPPDPEPIMNARPEPYAMEEMTTRVEMAKVTDRTQMDTTQREESNLQGTRTVVPPV